MKILKWLILGILAVLAALIMILGLGSSLSMDRSYTHTNETETLPLLSSANTTGLVRIKAGEFEYRARVAGLHQDAEQAPTVILLHGFPVTSAMWNPLITPLAESGYRVIAFDQRGYSPGARPVDQADYNISNLVGDVISIADALGAHKFHLIGHDWGSAVGWLTVMQHPERVLSWTGLSIAHPVAFGEALASDPDQRSRSGYFTLFVTPYLPEALFTFNGLSLLNAVYSGMAEQSKQEYLNIFSEPRALTSALNWYRQMGVSSDNAQTPNPNIKTPTLYIWGNKDPTAGRISVEKQIKYMKGPYSELELNGEHWLMSTHAADIIPAVLQHLNHNYTTP